MPQTPVTKQWTDFSLDFSPHPISGDLSVLQGDAAIIQSIRTLVLTNYYERRFNPERGSGVHYQLFQNATPMTSKLLEDRIRTVIENYEPRVSISNINVQVVPGQNAIKVSLYFYILNNTSLTSSVIFLERNR